MGCLLKSRTTGRYARLVGQIMVTRCWVLRTESADPRESAPAANHFATHKNALVVGAIGRWHLENVTILSTVTAVLSNLVSNVPAVLGFEAICGVPAGPAKSVAYHRDGIHAGGQLYAARIGGQSDRRAERPSARDPDRVLGLLQGRRSADSDHDSSRDPLSLIAEVSCPFLSRPPIGTPHMDGCADDRGAMRRLSGTFAAACLLGAVTVQRTLKHHES